MSPAITRPLTYSADASIPRFTRARYQKMVDSGVLDDEDQVELFDGYLVLKVPRDPEHDIALQLTDAALRPRTPPGWNFRVQMSLDLGTSQFEPDLAVVRGFLANSPRNRHPLGIEVGLVVEVANTSLTRDTHDKARVYAQNRVPIYWVVNLPFRAVEVFSDPLGDGFQRRDVYRTGSDVPYILDGQTLTAVPVAEVMP